MSRCIEVIQWCSITLKSREPCGHGAQQAASLQGRRGIVRERNDKLPCIAPVKLQVRRIPERKLHEY